MPVPQGTEILVIESQGTEILVTESQGYESQGLNCQLTASWPTEILMTEP